MVSYEILKAKEWRRGAAAPARVVLVSWDNGREFSTHVEVDHADLGRSLCWGDYFASREAAERAFEERVI